MLPTKEQLIQHLTDKMTNKDIAIIYETTFQKIIQLIKKNDLNPIELRKVNRFIVYEHWYNGKVFLLEAVFGIDAEDILIEETRNMFI
ncbi:hypothetical protein ACXM0N_06935 [Peribacillus simplex]